MGQKTAMLRVKSRSHLVMAKRLASRENEPLISAESVERRIHRIRDQKVMLDTDLAELYDVTTKNLNRAVSRNRQRFPNDFMFQLTPDELENLRFQSGTSSWGGRR
jgi:hypothetical protein